MSIHFATFVAMKGVLPLVKTWPNEVNTLLVVFHFEVQSHLQNQSKLNIYNFKTLNLDEK